MSNRHLSLVIVLSVLLPGAPSIGRSLDAGSRQAAQNSTVPRLTLNITNRWNAPVTIKSVRIGDQEVLPGSSIEATDDWAKYLSIEGINKSEKTISYIAYAIDFTISDEESLYRFRLQDGIFYASPDALTAPDGLRVLKGQKHKMRFTDDAWRCHSAVVDRLNERKARVVNVELFVESVGFTDDTVWAFGSLLKRNKKTSLFEKIE